MNDPMASAVFTIRPVEDSDRGWMREWMVEHWGAANMVMRGRQVFTAEHSGFAALIDGRVKGLVTYLVAGDRCEITSLDSLSEGIGIGTALLHAVRSAAVDAGCARITLITTNDNLRALGFYQKRGYRLSALFANSIEEMRRTLKPEISMIGMNGIPIRDEIELELKLKS